ncbi:MAG: hypothetical protein HY319_13670 [Armatimonadetes bacterium]|nr:hypothetical protein [Armatimonadota bacterium]
MKVSYLPTARTNLSRAAAAPESREAPESSAPADRAELGAAPSQDGRKKWTVLVYANGKADGLDRLAPSVLRELEVAGSDQNLNIVAELGREKRWYDRVSKDWHGVKRYEVQRNPDPAPLQQEVLRWFVPPYTDGIISPVKEDLGDVDMGSSASLSDFLSWGIKNYPAEHYAVIIYGQGAGFAGSALDETTGQVVTNKGLEQALREARHEAGKKLDLVAFDSNLMGQLEVAHQLKDVADFMVASEAQVALGSLSLDMVMKDLKFELAEKGNVTPEQLARWFVFETAAQPKPLAEMVNPTLTAVDLSKIEAVKGAYGALADALAGDLSADPERKAALREILEKTQSFAAESASHDFYHDFRDVGHFAELLAADGRFSDGVKTAAGAVLGATGQATVDHAAIGAAVENAHGLSAYLPLDYGYDMPATFRQPKMHDPLHGWNDTSVSQETNWGKLLQQISEDSGFHQGLRSLGLSDAWINKVDKTLGLGKKAVRFVLGLGSNIGHWQAYRAARNQGASSYFGIPPKFGLPLAIAGGARDTVRGAGQVVSAAGEDKLVNKRQKIVDGVLDVVTGVAVSAAAVGMLFPAAAALAQPAGIAAFGIPLAKAGYDIWETSHKTAAAREEMDALTPDQRRQAHASKQDDDSYHYISPVVRGLSYLNSPGPIDQRKVSA